MRTTRRRWLRRKARTPYSGQAVSEVRGRQIFHLGEAVWAGESVTFRAPSMTCTHSELFYQHHPMDCRGTRIRVRTASMSDRAAWPYGGSVAPYAMP